MALNPRPRISLTTSPRLRYATFFVLYIAQGIPAGFSRTAMANHLVARGLGPVEVGTYLSVIGLPWAFQMIWGIVVDRYPGLSLRMGERRPWVVAAQLLTLAASFGLLVVRDPVIQLRALTLAFLFQNIFGALQGTGIDALAIVVTPQRERGRVNACSQAGLAAGVGIGAAGLVPLLRTHGFRTAATAESLALLALLVITFFVRERHSDCLLPQRCASVAEPANAPIGDDGTTPGIPLRELLPRLARAVFRPASIVPFAAIAAAYVAEIAFMSAFPRYLIGERQWGEESLSVISGVYGPICALLINLGGGWAADRIGPRRLLTGALAAGSIFLGVFCAYPALWALPGLGTAGLLGSQLIDPCLGVAALPLLMSFCRRGLEGSQFTTYMAFVNFSNTIGTYVAGRALLVTSVPGVGWAAAGVLAIAAVTVRLAPVPAATVPAGALPEAPPQPSVEATAA